MSTLLVIRDYASYSQEQSNAKNKIDAEINEYCAHLGLKQCFIIIAYCGTPKDLEEMMYETIKYSADIAQECIKYIVDLGLWWQRGVKFEGNKIILKAVARQGDQAIDTMQSMIIRYNRVFSLRSKECLDLMKKVFSQKINDVDSLVKKPKSCSQTTM